MLGSTMYKFNKMFIRRLMTIKNTPVPLQKIDRIQEDEKVLKPFIHIQKANKKLPRELYRSFNYWLRVHEDKRRDIEDCIQTYHSASLIIDDIQDNSTFRYQVPVAHVVYTLALTINAAGHGLVLALQKLVALEPKAIGIFIQASIDNYRGQGMDIYWRDNLVCPSEEEYIDMISQKTSMLFILAYQLHQLFSHDKTDYTKLANLIGIYYQIRDDYCNLFAQKHTDNKTYCSDITEGKYSLPIIHALKHSDNAGQIINILKLRTQDPDLKSYCISLLDKVGSFRYTREMLRKLESDIYNEINSLGGNPELVTVMEKLGDWRTYSKD